ncbi:MAG: M3 family oligoendopeptidase [Clostridia bacterium]
MKTRNEIDNKYKWDLTDICSLAQIDERMAEYKSLAPKLASFAGKLHDKGSIKEFFELDEKCEAIIEPAIFYVVREMSTNIADVTMQKKYREMELMFQESAKYTTYFVPELNKLPTSFIQELIADPDFADHDMFFKDLLKNKKHIVSKRNQDFLNDMSMFVGCEGEIRDMLCDSELHFDDALDSQGKLHSVNEAEYGKLLESKDRTLRENAMKSLLNGYGKFNKTLALAYTAHVQGDIFSSKLAKFRSPLEQALNEYSISPKVYNNLIAQVHKHKGILQGLIDLTKTMTGIQDLAFWDMRAPIGELEREYTIEEMQDIILQSLAPLGKEYLDLVKSKFQDKSIDYMPNKDKESGAYSSAIYGYKSVIFMNNDGKFGSVETLIHEMGHAIHSELYNRAQPRAKAGISIFLAEIASTTNEILLLRYMIENASSQQERNLYIMKMLRMFNSTIFTQTLYSEFEHYAHERLQDGEPLTYQEYNDKYASLNREYYGKELIIPECAQYIWSRIPHFYRSYYVYQYATGMICALYIVDKIFSESGFAEKYLDFLRLGEAELPLDALKTLGIDLTKTATFDSAFRYAKQLITQISKQ